MWPESDAELVRRMLRGDEDAFERFFHVAYPAIYRFALARLDLDHDTAGEIAQATVCRAIQNLVSFRGEAALLTWVYTIGRNQLYAHGQRHGRTQIALVEDDPEVRAALESLRAASAEPLDAALDRSKVASRVQRALDHLPPRYADALEWKYIDEMPVQEIAVRLGIGVKAAESVLTRARAAFRDAFTTMTTQRVP